MVDNTEPRRFFYGQKKILTVESIRENSHREPKDYDAYDRPYNWVTITRYSIRFKGGGWFEGQVENQNINIHRGDTFETWILNTHFTYLKNLNTGKVHYDKPIENPEWVKYTKKKNEEAVELAKREWNQKNIWKRIECQRHWLLLVIIIFGILSIETKSIIPFIPVPIIFLILLSNKN